MWSRHVPAATADTALRHSAVWACSTLIADIISTFPFKAYRDVGGVASALDATPRIIKAPSAVQTPIGWRFSVLMSQLLTGDAWGEVTASNGVYPEQIELINGNRVGYTSNPGEYDSTCWTLDGKRVDLWPLGPLWRLPGYVLPGRPFGLSVLSYAASAIGLGQSAEAFGRDWFTDSAHPSALLRNTSTPIDKEQAQTVKDRWRAMFNGNRDPAVLGPDWEYTPIQLSKDDSQFLETISANVATIARFFRVPVELINGESGNSLTYSNLSDRNLSLLQYTLAPWLVRLEEALTACVPNGQYVKGNENALLRTDNKTQAEIIDMQVKNGTMLVDEARALAERGPLNGAGNETSPRSIAEAIQKIYLGVDTLMSADEARSIINRLGAGLDGDFQPSGRPLPPPPTGGNSAP